MAQNSRIEELRRRVLADPASIVFAQLAEEQRRAGRYLDAVEVCRAGLERYPGYLSARVTLGRALIELGELDAASQELERVLQMAPDNLAAIRGLAEIHQRRRDDVAGSTEYYEKSSVQPSQGYGTLDIGHGASDGLRTLDPFSLETLDADLGGTVAPRHVDALLDGEGESTEALFPADGFVVTDLDRLPDAEPTDDPFADLEQGLREHASGTRDEALRRGGRQLSPEELDRAMLAELERWLETIERGEA